MPGPATAPNAEEVAASLRLAITRTARRLRQDALRREAGSELTPSQGSALAVIERDGPLTPSELAEREMVKRPTATRIIACLEEAGLVQRTPDPDDGRSALIGTTAAGRELVRRLRTRKNAYLARRLRGAGAEDLEALARAAAVLERLLEEERA